jgi:integrase
MSIFERFERHADRTFAEAAERYLLEYDGIDKSRAVQSLNAVMPYVGHLRMIDVDDEACLQFKHDRRNGIGHFDKPAMVGTINKDLTQIATVANRAAKVWRWLPSAPRIEHVSGDVRKPYPFSWSEQDKLFSALPTGWDCGAALFAVNTGVRKAELFGLKWEDQRDVPELGEGVFVFILNRTKNGRQRPVVCNSIARRAVNYQRKFQEKWDAKSEYVFPSRAPGRKNTKVRDAGKCWDDAWRKAGLPYDKLTKRGLHSARHTYAHRLRAAGVVEEDRNALLGHNNYNLAQHYAMPDLKRLLEAAELVTIRNETTVLRGGHHSSSGAGKHY